MKKRLFVAFGIVLLLVAASAVYLMAFRTPEVQKVRLMLDWAPNTNHTGIYVALENGWFQKQGIDLEVITPAGVSVESVVGAGKAEFGVGFQEYVTNARLENVPIISIAAVMQHNTSGFAALRGRRIARAADFAGKRYGGWGLPMEAAIIKAMMLHDGGDPGSVKTVNIGTGDLLAMLERDIDFAWIFYGWQGIEAKLRGLDINVVMMSDYFDAVPDYYTPVLITSENLIAENPGLVKRFLAAAARGYEYAGSHPAESAQILLKHAPELSPELVRESQKWISPRYAQDAPQWGYQSTEVWKRFSEWMLENELIARPFDYEKAFTNAFLPKR